MVEPAWIRHELSVGVSAHTIVALPHTDGELSRVLGDLEEVLLLVDQFSVDDVLPLPWPLDDREAADAVGRLGSYVAGVEREAPAVQPVAPDGRLELVPLFFVTLARRDLDRVLGAVDQLHAAAGGGSHPVVEEALIEYTSTPESARGLAHAAGRLGELLRVPWDDGVGLLHARLDRGSFAVGRASERVVLTAHEHSAYERVTDRILTTWHANDPLERFVYRGSDWQLGADDGW